MLIYVSDVFDHRVALIAPELHLGIIVVLGSLLSLQLVEGVVGVRREGIREALLNETAALPIGVLPLLIVGS